MAGAAPAAVTDVVRIRGLAQPLNFARIWRGDIAYAVRAQLSLAEIIEERAIRDAAAEDGDDACVEASAAELVALKALGAEGGVPARSARATLVDVCWLASRVRSDAVYLLQARFLFTGATALPATLPEGQEEEDVSSDDESDAEPEGTIHIINALTFLNLFANLCARKMNAKHL